MATSGKIGILITGKAALGLQERARFLGIKAEDLANRVVEQYLKENADETVGPNDDRFKKVASLILRRNSKLYRKLSK